MGCIQMGPKAAVGGMQYLEAPPGAAKRSPALSGHQGRVSTTSSRRPQPWGVGRDPALSGPLGQPRGSLGGWWACAPPHHIVSPSSSSTP